MAVRFGGSLVTPVIAIAGLALVGVGGYRMISGNCIFSGACLDKGANATNVAATTEDGCCPLTGNSVTAASMEGACPMSGSCGDKPACEAACEGEASVINAAATPAGECKELKDGCKGDGQNGCCGGCAGKETAGGEGCCESKDGAATPVEHKEGGQG